MVFKPKTVFVIRCILICYKKEEFRPDNHEYSPINQTEFTVKGLYIHTFLLQTSMVTVTINIKPYLAGYMYVRYRQSLEPDPENQSHSSSPSSSKRLIPIHLSHITPVYHFLHQLSVPHPQNTSWKEIEIFAFCTAQTA